MIAISNGYYSDNTTESGFGGIYIANSSTLEVVTSFYMQDTFVSNNKALQGAAIYLSTKTLSNDSYIRNTTFENNKTDERGVVFLSFDAGIMEISDNLFQNNRGIESCISINTNPNTDINPSYTKIQNNLYQSNEGIIISLLENILISNLQLEKNEFTQNSG